MVLNHIRDFIELHKYPPTVRDICKATGLKSSSTVHGHLKKLEEKGYIRRDPTRSRTIELLSYHPPATNKNIIDIPLVEKITAGEPILATENIEDIFPLPSDLVGSENAFMLHVRGDSMIEAGILNGDYLIVRPQNTANNGDIIVALLGEKATVKYFYHNGDYVKLVPANKQMEPIITKDIKILGKVISLYRRLS